MFPVFIAGLCLVICGCGREELPTAKVEGKVLYNDEPLRFGSVTFRPQAGPPATGEIQPDGTFELSTYADGDGALIGKHKVAIACYESQAPDAPPPDPEEEETVGKPLIPERYTSFARSEIEVEVKETNEPFIFKLTD